MATYVNDLRLKEIGTGESSGTWGTETNVNLELIGEALGYGTEGITTNADTHTSTVADGATDPVRAMFVKYTGTLDSACTITIAPNTVNRMQFIENGTSGSQNIIISQGSGANITIPPGDVKAVYLDGAGSGAAVVDAFASLSVVDLKVQDDLTVTGDLDVDGTANLDIVDIDGAVDMASTLTVAGVLTGASLDISGDIDIDGTANLDVVDIDGAVDMATTLAVAGNVDFNGDLDVDGTANLDIVDIDGALTQDGGAVFNEDSADVDFRVESDGDTHALFLDGGASKLGINTSSPEHDLHVVTAGSSNEDGVIKIGGTSVNVGLELMYDQSGATTTTINVNPGYSGGVLETKITGNVVHKIDNAGHVTMPLQPAFSAQTSAALTDIATDAGRNTVKFGTQIFDLNADFNTTTFQFTAPVAGKYQLNTIVYAENSDAEASYIRVEIMTSNRNYTNIIDPEYSADRARDIFTLSVLADMDASDTAHIDIGQHEGTAQMDVPASTNSNFSGFLVC